MHAAACDLTLLPSVRAARRYASAAARESAARDEVVLIVASEPPYAEAMGDRRAAGVALSAEDVALIDALYDDERRASHGASSRSISNPSTTPASKRSIWSWSARALDARSSSSRSSYQNAVLQNGETSSEPSLDSKRATARHDEHRRVPRKLVLLVFSGRPLVVPTQTLDKLDAFVAGWLPGPEGGGVVDVLCGDVPFTGKLGFSWPADSSQMTRESRQVSDGSSDGRVAGERASDDRERRPLYSVGHGLTLPTRQESRDSI